MAGGGEAGEDVADARGADDGFGVFLGLGCEDGAQAEIVGSGFAGAEGLFLGAGGDADDFVGAKQVPGLGVGCCMVSVA